MLHTAAGCIMLPQNVAFVVEAGCDLSTATGAKLDSKFSPAAFERLPPGSPTNIAFAAERGQSPT